MLISQNEVPFDVHSYRYCMYTADKLQLLQKNLIETVKTLTPARKQITKPLDEPYESEALILGDNDTFYRFSVRVVQVAEGAAKLRLEVWSDNEPELRRCEDHVPRISQTVAIPKIHYAVKLHAAHSNSAEFCICNPYPPQT